MFIRFDPIYLNNIMTLQVNDIEISVHRPLNRESGIFYSLKLQQLNNVLKVFRISLIKLIQFLAIHIQYAYYLVVMI